MKTQIGIAIMMIGFVAGINGQVLLSAVALSVGLLLTVCGGEE